MPFSATLNRLIIFEMCQTFSLIFASNRSVSNEVTSGSKTAEFKSNEKAIFWGIKKMLGGKEHFAKFKVRKTNELLRVNDSVRGVGLAQWLQ